MLDLITRLMTHHPVADQQAPALYRPVWHVGHLVYQGGNPSLKRSSLTGGGFLAMRDPPMGREQPSWWPNATPLVSQVGSGFLPTRPLFTAPLGGGTSTSQF